MAESWKIILRNYIGNANETSEERSNRKWKQNEHLGWQRLTENTDKRGGQLEIKRMKLCRADQEKVLAPSSQWAIIIIEGRRNTVTIHYHRELAEQFIGGIC